MNDDNPYAAPQSPTQPQPLAVDSGNERCWRDGTELLVRPDADLPRRCVKCGAAASEYRSRRFYWHSPWLYLLILLHLFIYAIVALIVRKSATHRVGLCAQHQRQRRNYIWMAWLSLLPLLGGFMFESAVMILLGMLVFLVMLVCGLFGIRVLKPKRITPQLAVYSGVSPRLLAGLPRYPYPRE